MSNSGHTALDHVGAITLAESIRNMALGAGAFLVADSGTVEGKATIGSFNLVHYAAAAFAGRPEQHLRNGHPPAEIGAHLAHQRKALAIFNGWGFCSLGHENVRVLQMVQNENLFCSKVPAQQSRRPTAKLAILVGIVRV